MNHKERMLAALKCQPVDRIPHGEQMLHDILIQKILKVKMPKAEENALVRWMTEELSDFQFDCHKKAREFLGFDFIHVFPREPWIKIDESKEGYPIYRDIWGMEAISTPFTYEILKKPVEKPGDLKTHQFPTIDEFKYDNLHKWVQKSDFFVVVQIETGFFKINQFMGFNNYMFYLYEHRKELLDFTARFFDHVFNLAKKVIQEGADCIWLSNDFAYNTGPFMSPKDLWEMDFSFMKDVVRKIHDLGKPVVLHGCGNQNYTLDMLLDCEIDGLHSLQPTAGNDICQIKEKCGDRLCLIGNIDISELLPFGSPYDVDQAIQDLVEKVGKKNGLVIATCNLLDMDIPIENAITMHFAVDKYSARYL
ncbi:uroporphyrinogen decarboxylase family protein [Atribacter laminatus]|uniref:Uroporphyrinogen decarboxylase (URO-D) domain-containing protein n=1 Tax=Atribacter laminatus TaxID=2847778 RepID=A0A7T1F2H3_ATRLM|nr:uroporphyrinogen decarboxylase family protein [Atribacter laminatus]QPM68018.1 hypothetical protein RT761_01232 [Atribacter laminatus]